MITPPDSDPIILVDGTHVDGYPDRIIRVHLPDIIYYVDVEDDHPFGKESTDKKETDAQVIERLRRQFSILEDMTAAVAKGIVRGMVVTGPPGVGKSFGVERILQEQQAIKKVSGGTMTLGMEKGAASPIGLYKLLYEYSTPGSLLILDDCDTVLTDETSLNLLKAALDSSKNRRISWRSESMTLKREDIPTSFNFHGSIIFITNVNFERCKGKIADHLKAIMSRCHYLDLTMDSMRDRFLRCRQIVADGMLDSYNFTDHEKQEILDFVYNNKDRLREVSLRMVTKLADLRKMDPVNWEIYASSTCIRQR